MGKSLFSQMIKLKRLGLALLLTLSVLFSTSGLFAKSRKDYRPCLETRITRTLVQYALLAEDLRRLQNIASWEPFFLAYKNDPKFAAWLSKLSKKDLESTPKNEFAEIILKKWQFVSKAERDLIQPLPSKTVELDLRIDMLLEHKIYSDKNLLDNPLQYFLATEEIPSVLGKDKIPVFPNGSFSEYDIAIIQLRKGDKVVFGSEEFVLGNFLGAGNTSHVFEIEGQSDSVLKLAFLSQFLGDPTVNRESRRRLAIDFFSRLQTEYKKIKATGVNVVQLIGGNSFEGYMVLKKVETEIDGLTFYQRILRRHFNWHSAKLTPDKYGEIIKKMTDSNDMDLYYFLELYHEAKKIEKVHATDKDRGVEQFFRQFAIDKKVGRWILLDWE